MSINDSPFEEKPRLSSGLNTLTILTIVGNIITLISSVWTFINAKHSYESMRDTIESGKLDGSPQWVKNMLSPELLEMTRKMYEFRLPVMLIGLLGSALCLFGAVEMRKLRKQGYPLWLIGEIIPIGTMFFLIGTIAFTGFSLISLLFPLVFIVLFTVFKKELIF